MRQATHVLRVRTRRRGLVEITDEIRTWCGAQSITTGLLTLFCRHTSASLLIQENAAPEVRADLETFFEQIAPEEPGRYTHDEFAVVHEVNLNVGCNLRSWLSAYVGYTFLYASDVVRPGEQFSPVVNPAIIPTSPAFGTGGFIATPNPVLTQSEYWIQGVNFGVRLRY